MKRHKIRGNFHLSCEISGFRHEADENCALLGYYTAYSGNSLPTFREKVQESKKILDSLRNYQYTLRHGPERPNSLRLSSVPVLAKHYEDVFLIPALDGGSWFATATWCFKLSVTRGGEFKSQLLHRTDQF